MSSGPVVLDPTPPTAPPPDPGPPTRSGGFSVRALGLDRFSGLYVWVGVIVLFSILRPDTFATVSNARIIAADEAITAVITLALTAALASGAFDISIAATMTWSIVCVAWLQSTHGVSPPLAIALTLLSAVVIGLVNGFITVRLHVEPIIATMGTSAVITALAFWRADGRSIVTGIPQGFKDMARGQVAGIPYTVVYLAVIAALLYYLLGHTPTGRFMYATGGNEAAARLAGIRVGRLTFYGFIIAAVVASIAGILLTARVGNAGIDTGAPYLLPAFSGAFLGSTQIKPGRFNILGSLVAVYLLATGVKGLQMVFPSEPWIKDMFTGLTLIIAVSLAARASRRTKE